jgi:hypothetical protein
LQRFATEAKMRFICEWCREKVWISETEQACVAVVSHLTTCAQRPGALTQAQITGLAEHIAGLLADADDVTLRIDRQRRAKSVAMSR